MGLTPGEQMIVASMVKLSQIVSEKGEVYQRDTDKQNQSVSDKASSSPAQIQSPADKVPPPAA